MDTTHANAKTTFWLLGPAVLFAAILLAFGTLAIAGPGGATTKPSASVLPSTQPAGAKWELVWSDEFNYEGLPDPKKWGYEEGFVRNGEAQYYTKGRLENARVENGMLVIEARREKFTNPTYDPRAKGGPNSRKTAEYTSASLATLKKADWQFGRIEVRAKLPHGRGVWPAIWMLGTDREKVGWPACGEIDIMEFVGHTPDHIYATVHFQEDGKHKSSGKSWVVDKPFDDFHVYAVEWYPDHMDFFFDDKKYNSFTVDQAANKGDNPFRKPQYLLINLAIGGDWGGKIDDTIFPQKYLIDYVRVYQDAHVPAPR